MAKGLVVSDKVIADAKVWLVEASDKWRTQVCRGETWHLDGTYIRGKDYGICHAWVSQTFRTLCWGKDVYDYSFSADRKFTSYTKDAPNFLTLSCHSKKRSKGICTDEAHEAIVLFIASDECPLSQFILNRDDKDSLINGGVIILCGPDGATDAQALWICKALRYGVEAGAALNVWHELYKNGVNPLLALYVATFVRTVKGATFGYTGKDGHSAVFGKGFDNNSKEVVEELLSGKMNDKAVSTWEVFQTGDYKKGTKLTSDAIRGFCAPVKKSDGWGGEVKGEGADKGEFVKRVLELQQTAEKNMDSSLLDKAAGLLRSFEPQRDTVFLEVDM